MFDVSDRALIEVTGRDRASFLHNFCTNDIKRLQPGDGCEGFVTNLKGRILGHVLVFAEESSLWIDSDPGTQAALLQHLGRYLITEDVQLHDRTSEFGRLLVCGRQAPPVLSEAFDIDGASTAMCGRVDSAVRAGIGWRRVPVAVVPAFLIAVPPSAQAEFAQRLQMQNVALAGADIREVLRIEAVWPRYGVDITDDHLAQEAGRTAQAISFTKGCYLGQEPIARLDALGHTNRELRGIRFETPGEIPVGATVFNDAGAGEVGKISSVATDPVTSCAVALAMLKTAANAPDTTVTARTSLGADIRGTVFGPPPIG